MLHCAQLLLLLLLASIPEIWCASFLCFLSPRRSENDKLRLKTKEASSMTWCYNCSISRLVCVAVYLKHEGAAAAVYNLSSFSVFPIYSVPIAVNTWLLFLSDYSLTWLYCHMSRNNYIITGIIMFIIELLWLWCKGSVSVKVFEVFDPVIISARHKWVCVTN